MRTNEQAENSKQMFVALAFRPFVAIHGSVFVCVCVLFILYLDILCIRVSLEKDF